MVAGSAVALSGCMGDRMTYGTGTSPGYQTVEDIGGLVSLGGGKKPYVKYQPRPKIVAPPANAALPAPSSNGELANANWPKDPDEIARQQRLARAKEGTSLIPGDNPDVEISGLPTSAKGDLRAMKVSAEDQATIDAQNVDKANKIRAEVKAADGGVDANGNRIRKTLVDPPIAYREPDPGAPTEFKTAKKKFRWPWQKADPNDLPEKPEQPSE